MKFEQKLLSVVASMFIMIGLFADDSVAKFTKPQTFKGKVVPIITQTIKYGFNDAFRGIINWTARPGTILYGPVYNEKGEITKKGSLMISMETEYRKALVDNSKAMIKVDEANLAFLKTQVKRYKGLSSKGAESIENYENFETQYRVAQNQLAGNIANYILNKTVYKMCWLYAQFDSIVEEVYFPYGLPAGELDVMKISQLNPIGIDIKMDRSLAVKLGRDTSVAIYPIDSDEPVMNIKGATIYTDEGFRMRVFNYQLPPKISKESGKRIPIVRCIPVARMFSHYQEKTTYGVPVDSICKDEKGSYVWKGIDAAQAAGQAFKNVFKVTKVYVKLGDAIKKIDGFLPYREVKIGGNLKVGDSIVIKPPKDLKENSEVDFGELRYMFMAGDEVKVVFEIK
jgi:hypothetical protein